MSHRSNKFWCFATLSGPLLKAVIVLQKYTLSNGSVSIYNGGLGLTFDIN